MINLKSLLNELITKKNYLNLFQFIVFLPSNIVNNYGLKYHVKQETTNSEKYYRVFIFTLNKFPVV